MIASNHQSFLDPIVVGLPLRRSVYFAARESLFNSFFFGTLIRVLNAVPVRTTSASPSMVRGTLDLLQRGEVLVIFPEGTRTRDGKLGPLRSGVVRLAQKAGVPIVPAMISGAFEVWPRHRRFPRPGPIRVAYGEPIPVPPGCSLDETLSRLRASMEDLTARGAISDSTA